MPWRTISSGRLPSRDSRKCRYSDCSISSSSLPAVSTASSGVSGGRRRWSLSALVEIRRALPSSPRLVAQSISGPASASRRVEQQELRENPFLERIEELNQLQKAGRAGAVFLQIAIQLDIAQVHVEVVELLAPRHVATRFGDQPAVLAAMAPTPFGDRPVANCQPNPCDCEHTAVVPVAGPKHDLDSSPRSNLSFERARRRNPAKAAVQLRRQPLSGGVD